MKGLNCLVAGLLAFGAEPAVAASCEAAHDGMEEDASVIDLEPSQDGTHFNGADKEYKIEMIAKDDDISLEIEDLAAGTKVSTTGSFNSSGTFFFVLESLKPDFEHLFIACKR